MPLLHVELACDSGQVEGLNVREKREAHLVEVRQLVAARVHAHEVGIALEREDLVAHAGRRRPRRHRRPLRVLGRRVARGEELGPRLEAGGGHQLVELVLLGVGRVELLEVVSGEEHSVGPVAAVLVRQRGEQQRVGLLVGPADSRRADLLDAGRRAVRVAHPGRKRRREVLVQQHVLIPEQDVVGGERRAVRPARALTELDRPGPEIFRRLPSGGDLRLDLGAVGRKSEEGVVDDAHVVVGVGRTQERAPPHAAVLAGPLDHRNHERIAGQALLHRRELAGLDLLGQRGRFLELRRLGAGRPDQGEHHHDARRWA